MLKLFGGKISLNIPQIIVLGFAAVILAGTGLLMLPVSSASGELTPFTEALFTSTTSVCVTGLVVHDTGTYWSGFGQAVILLLIQIGGLGVVTVSAMFAMIAGRRIGLFQRSTMQEAAAAPRIGGIVRLTVFILKTTFCIEGLGAAVMAPVLIRDFGLWRGIWMALFHSVSAFCNAGIDLMGVRSPYSSLTSYVGSPVINLCIMFLIVSGGLGFLTWEDICTHRNHLKKYRMQSKVILTTSAFLIVVPAVWFFFLEFANLPFLQRFWASLFQAVTPRTAGFNTVPLGEMSEASQVGIIGLMLIGGSPGSTAGGMKTTTFAVMAACAVCVFKKRESTQFFGRRVGQEVIYTASTLAFMYISLCVVSAAVISIYEGLPMIVCMYETASAVATVGLTLGITPELGTISRYILISLMYLGRVGGLTIIYAALSGRKQIGRLPLERLTVG